jgi:hypothetical protein
MIKDDCGVPTSMTFKTILGFCNGNCLLVVELMPTIDLLVGDDQQSILIVGLELTHCLIIPSHSGINAYP